ncbi:MAG TPA: ribose 5-phosphate isomerase A [Acidiphilium sp.]|jgi:ribose 5-phosphate isomerase A|uniref:ribose 5-phosphate isomerase A n=1 Tax=Acidiphilium sp. C61 TaxID=1671485 RepID=UPI00157AE49C|nr:ribose 5-phosphate isomerase A [Acidiphilium sp. C61]HQU11492.1 ribose 5-phosphate isomerase A [Acidiphilium sp.]
MGIDPEIGKRAVAREAAGLVAAGMRVGLGTGTTAAHFIDALAARVRAEALDIACVATSEQTAAQAEALGLRLAPFDAALDLAVDGADEIEFGTLRLIKGAGGALLREKLVAQSARRFIVIADRRKLVSRLGTRARLPVEIVQHGAERTCARLAELGLAPALRIAAGTRFITDGGHHIADCTLPADIAPEALDSGLRTIAGVVETGFFLSGCAAAIIGDEHGAIRNFDGDPVSSAGLAPVAAMLRRLDLPKPVAPPRLAVMGVSASGKSTIGLLLADALGVPFCDGDDLHPQANRAKMHAGKQLDDEDRMPWLHRIAMRLAEWRRTGTGGVIVSSLLTRRYRDLVRGGAGPFTLVHLDGSRELLAARIAARRGHFMPASLLDSQLATLEPPAADEDPIVMNIDAPPFSIVRRIVAELARRQGG